MHPWLNLPLVFPLFNLKQRKKQLNKKMKNQNKNILESGMTSIPLKHGLLGVTFEAISYWKSLLPKMNEPTK